MQIDRLNRRGIRPRTAPSGTSGPSPPAEDFSRLVETQEEEAPQATAQTQSVTAPAPAPASLPQMPPSAEAQDREARRHGGAMLRALGGLQVAMLRTGGVVGGEALRDLATLANAVPTAADPALDAVMRAIAQRAAIELARTEPQI